MKWIEPKHSKKRVRRAGCTLCERRFEPLKNTKQIRDAFVVLMNWRSAHAYPMHCLLILLRRKAMNIDKKALVVQRLKRTPSIVIKLMRYGNMSLDRMQDIGGLRAVVKDVHHVEKLRDALVKSKTQHILAREYDYITSPKESGYRGIHLVFKYGGTKLAYENLLVEIQLRSRVQHSWATAVEVVDAFTKQSLKTNQGSDDWKQFFNLISIGFAELEGKRDLSIIEWLSIREEINQLKELLHVEECLRAYVLSADVISTHKKMKSDAFFILISDISTQKTSIYSYPKNDLDEASKFYLLQEREYQNDSSKNIVMVSASSISNLKSAYTNYFADTRDFVKNMRLVLEVM